MKSWDDVDYRDILRGIAGLALILIVMAGLVVMVWYLGMSILAQ